MTRHEHGETNQELKRHVRAILRDSPADKKVVRIRSYPTGEDNKVKVIFGGMFTSVTRNHFEMDDDTFLGGQSPERGHRIGVVVGWK